MVVYFFSFILLLLFFIAFKKTIFGFSIERKNFNGIIFFQEYFLMVVLGVCIVVFFGIDKITVFYVNKDNLINSSLIILATFFLFLLTILFLSKTLFKKYLSFNCQYFNTVNSKFYINCFSFYLLFLVLFLHILGVKHAILSSMISGSDLLSTRLGNKYISNAPNFLLTNLRFIYIILAGFLAVNFSNKSISFYNKFFVFVLIVYASSLTGDKAPIINCFLIFIIGYFYSLGDKINFTKILKYSLPVLFVSLATIFYLIRVQFENLSVYETFEYILLRTSSGQMMGAYEQLDLKIQGFDYIWRSVPFANFFIDYKEYSKDLMLNTWGYYKSYSEVGVMNSYFIGEAYAIGGYFLLFISPFIVGFNYCLSLYVMIYIMHRFFKLDKGFSMRVIGITAIFLFPITGDIAGLLFLKLLVMYIIFLTPIFFLVGLSRSFK